MRIFEPNGNPFLVHLDPHFFQAGTYLLLLAQQAPRLNVELFHLVINVADGLAEGIRLRVETLCFLVVRSRVSRLSGQFDILLQLLAIAFHLA